MKIPKLVILAGLAVSTICAGTAQNPKQANIWYFGLKAGLDFTHGSPVALTNGAMEAYEGTATICDDNGNLLFYTNGGNQPYSGAVWNRRHQVMPNGYLENLTGCSSSIQSSVIVKKPGSDNFYYLFTTDCYENGFANGLSYSIIDMNLDGGQGDIVVKGEIITPRVTESLAAAAHANGKDYWIITHKVNSDSFFVYQLTNNGIAAVVKTRIGPLADEFVGELKVSANGQRLAFGGNSFTALFDFDASTGVLSNYRNLGANTFTICFSPNCELLYGANLITREIYQFDLLAANIAGSKQLIGSSPSYIGSMQMGPDGKIYVSIRNSQYIGVITRPNIRGIHCNFIKNDLYLNGKICKYGLPNYANNVLGECAPYPLEGPVKYEPHFLVRNVSSRQIILELTPSPEASGYRISRRKAGTLQWESFTAESNVFRNDNLEDNTEYEFRAEAVIYPDHIYELIHHHDFEQILNGKGSAAVQTFKVTTSNGFDFDVYPNPAKEKVGLEMNLKKNSPVEILITDLGGKAVYSKTIEGKTGLQQLELPLDNIQNGIYQLSLKCGSISGYKKLVVMD